MPKPDGSMDSLKTGTGEQTSRMTSPELKRATDQDAVSTGEAAN